MPAPSRNQLLTEVLDEEPKVEKKQLIIRSIRVDPYTLIRRRELLTPSMCQRPGCNYDAATANQFDGWHSVPESKRDILLEVLQKHIETAHNRSEDLILNEDEVPGQWLGRHSD